MNEEFTFAVETVSEWQEAEGYLGSFEWKSIQNEAQGNLTSFLSAKHPTKYHGVWNKLVREAKPRVEEIVIPSAVQFQINHGLRQKFLDYVRWDVLGMVMEATYKSLNPPVFTSKFLLPVYSKGRMPCGWKGEWPNGQLVVV